MYVSLNTKRVINSVNNNQLFNWVILNFLKSPEPSNRIFSFNFEILSYK